MKESTRIGAIRKQLQQEPDSAFLQFALAIELKRAMRYDEAINLLSSLKKSQPGYIATYYHLGGLYASTGQNALARSCYLEGVECAKAAKDQHSLAELLQALQLLDA